MVKEATEYRLLRIPNQEFLNPILGSPHQLVTHLTRLITSERLIACLTYVGTLLFQGGNGPNGRGASVRHAV